MLQLRYLIIILVGALFLFSCKKENERPQWDVEVIGPLLRASLSIDDLFADSILSYTSDGAVSILYEQSFYELEPDSIYEMKDTSLTNLVIWPLFSTPIQPGFPFYSNDNRIALGLGDVQLIKAYMKGGFIQITLSNALPRKVIYTYTIPKAKKTGNIFRVVQEVDAATPSGPGMFTGLFDLSNYELDLTGSDGTRFNTVAYNVEAVSDPGSTAFTLFNNDTIINIKTNLIDLDPMYVKGYLGQAIVQSSESDNTGLRRHIQSGLILLDSVSLNIEVENFIGADLQARLNSFTSVNTLTGGNVSLTAPSILNRTLNINRAQESGPAPSPVISSKHVYHLDNSNSNIKSFIENLPDRISHDAEFSLNPFGNFSFYNDFLYSDHLIDGNIKLEMPLRFAAQNLVMADTQDLSLTNFTNLDPVGPAVFTLVADNGFPLDLDIQILILDENYHVRDTLLIPGNIQRAYVDAQYKVIGRRETRMEIPVDTFRKSILMNNKYAVFRIGFNTPDFPQKIQLYSSYRLDLKLIADGTYYIR